MKMFANPGNTKVILDPEYKQEIMVYVTKDEAAKLINSLVNQLAESYPEGTPFGALPYLSFETERLGVYRHLYFVVTKES